MAFQFGDVVLVSFPFTDQVTTKQRPGVIVSSNIYHQTHRDLILMAITSQIRVNTSYGEVALQDWHSAGLLKSSTVKPVIATIEQTLVIKTLGKLSVRDQQALREAIHKIVG